MRLDSTADLSWVKDRINQVYMRVCVESGATETYAQMALTANTSTYTVSSSIVRIYEVILTPSGQTSPSKPLELLPLEELLNRRSGAPTGSPTAYAVFGRNQLEVSPIPEAADTLTMWYVAAPTALSANGDLPVIAEPYATEILVYGTCAEAADFMVDPRRDEYRQMYQDAMARYRVHLNRYGGGKTTQIPVARSRSYPLHNNSQDSVWAR